MEHPDVENDAGAEVEAGPDQAPDTPATLSKSHRLRVVFTI